MKKIFAIALALVMVLSMASAFALTCTTGYDWACATTTYDCGKAKIEVVPFVRSNDACDSQSNFVQSNCAAAVVGERVYYAYKLTVDANVNKEWYELAKVDVTFDNLKEKDTDTTELVDTKDAFDLPAWTTLVADEVDENGGVYWFSPAGWQLEKNYKNTVFANWVMKSGAKVCATLVNEYSPVNGYVEISKWDVIYRAGDKNLVFDIFNAADTNKTFDAADEYSAAIIHLNSDDKVEWVASDYDGTEKFVAWDGDMLVKEDGTRVSTSCGNAAKVAEVLKYFNINFSTCLTQKAIKANLGWKDKIESCYSWSKNAMAVVDAECVVAIPKTGDASVLAWLF